MVILVLGTPGSGKSEMAEEIAMQLAAGQDKLYIATMIPFGEEGKKRIEKHRKMRDGKGFRTVEKYTAIDSLAREGDGLTEARGLRDARGLAESGCQPVGGGLRETCCLLECMSNLVGNEMHDPRNRALSDDALKKLITEEVLALGKSCRHLVIVANCFLTEADGYDEDTRRYVKLANEVNEVLKGRADKVYEQAEGEWRVSEYS